MQEFWDIYDKGRNKTGKTKQREVEPLEEGEYHIVVAAIIMNSKNEILIDKRAKHKKFGDMWECSGGSILAGESSLEGIIREVKEELGIIFSKKEAIYLDEIRKDETPCNFKDLWLFRRDFDPKELTFPDKEATEAKWVTIEEFINMYDSNEIIPVVDFGIEQYNKALNIKQKEAYQYIGNTVRVEIDRPIGSVHPKHSDLIYPINYGYIPGTVSGDGEEIDCYILGIKEPLKTFEGKCIAVLHRTNDEDDKLIVVPKDISYTDEEILKEVEFQEKYFESEIIR